MVMKIKKFPSLQSQQEQFCYHRWKMIEDVDIWLTTIYRIYESKQAIGSLKFDS